MAGLDDVRMPDLRDCIASIALSGGKPAIHETEEIVTNLRQVDFGRDPLSEFDSEVQFQMQTRPLLGGNQISPLYANAMMNAVIERQKYWNGNRLLSNCSECKLICF